MYVGVQMRPWGAERLENDLPGCLAEAKAAGFDGFELGLRYVELDHPETLAGLARRAGLQVVGIHVAAHLYDAQAAADVQAKRDAILDYLVAVGAPFLPLTGLSKPGKTEQEMAFEAQVIDGLGAACRARGIVLAYHNHNWEFADGRRGIDYLLARTNPAHVSLCLDVAWVLRAGDAPAQAVRDYAARLAYLHIKDTSADQWIELGDGQVDLPAVLAAMPQGLAWLVNEQDETTLAPAEMARRNRAYLRAAGY